MKKLITATITTILLSSSISFSQASEYDGCLNNYSAAYRSFNAEKENLKQNLAYLGTGTAFLSLATIIASSIVKDHHQDDLSRNLAIGGSIGLASGIGIDVLAANVQTTKANPYAEPISILTYVSGQENLGSSHKALFDHLYQDVTAKYPQISYAETIEILQEGFKSKALCGYYPATRASILDYILRKAKHGEDNFSRSSGKVIIEDANESYIEISSSAVQY